MIAADAPLLQTILDDRPKPFALVCAERLRAFTEKHFDPTSDESWRTLDHLWRGAVMARDVHRYLLNERLRDECREIGAQTDLRTWVEIASDDAGVPLRGEL